MAETIHLNGTSLSLAHKGCSGITKNTVPDVCKTPSPGGPVPVPYPVIISRSDSLDKGTSTVLVDGGNSAAIKGSEYSTCNGDEAGTAGGVKSSTNMKEATWILYSFDVKLEGKNACRLSDKMMMNHGNTACLGGTLHAPVPDLDQCSAVGLRKLAQECNKRINCSKEDGGTCPDEIPSGQTCTTLGTKKHQCCEEAIKEHTKKYPSCGFRSEVGFPAGSNDDARNLAAKDYQKAIRKCRKKGFSLLQARAACNKAKVYIKSYYANGGARFRADVLTGDPPSAAYDFKFNCKKKGRISRTQKKNYFKYTGKYPEMIHHDGGTCSGCQ